tara:strand:- start:205 stop:456 length:252 start_codon:yes stop_codon:yes gene_type:complete
MRLVLTNKMKRVLELPFQYEAGFDEQIVKMLSEEQTANEDKSRAGVKQIGGRFLCPVSGACDQGKEMPGDQYASRGAQADVAS